MILIFTLKSAYSDAGYVAGPFDIYGTTSGGSTTLLSNNVSKVTLLAGITISGIDEATTGGTIQSVDGTCSNSIQWSVNSASTTYTFQKYCSQNEAAHPISNAPNTVVFTGAELGFTPVLDDFITIAGSPNVDFIFKYTGDTNAAQTAHSGPTKIEANEFTCDGDIVPDI